MKVVDFIPEVPKDYKNSNVDFIKISDYNKILVFKGEKELHLKDNEVLLLSNRLNNPINKKLKNSNKITIKGKEYVVKILKLYKKTFKL